MLSFALLLAGCLSTAPALSDETAPAARPGAPGQMRIFDAGPEAARDSPSLWPSVGTWGQGIDALRANQLALEGAQQLTQQGPDAKGQGAGGILSDPDEISRQSNNPLGGDFILWLNFFDIDQQQGNITDQNRYAYNHLLQPVVPFRMPQLGEHWILVNRPTIPTTIDQEVAQGPDPSKPGILEFENKSGFGDVEYFALLGTSTPTDSGWLAESFGEGDTVFAPGFTTLFPTGRKSLSNNVYAAGPAITAAYVGKDWTFATLAQHWWDYEKQDDAKNFNFTRLQIFYFKSFPGGWQVGGTPKITADWTESKDDRWTVPVGLGVFKTILFGDLPIKLGVEFKPSITRPDSFGTDWQVEFTIIPVTSNFIGDLFK